MLPDEFMAPEGMFVVHLATMAPGLAHVGQLATSFAALMRNAPDEANAPALEAWLAIVKGTMLNGFVRDIERDRDAVMAELRRQRETCH
jgi:hypothetical protein